MLATLRNVAILPHSLDRESKHTWHLRPELDLTSPACASPVALLVLSLSRFSFNATKDVFCRSCCDSDRIV